jgi:excinuclease UvrABC ATPase subunit
VRARIDGVLRSLDDDIPLDKRRNHTIEVVVDRLLVKPGIEKRLEASIETATKLANGLVLIAVVNGEERLYSQKLACTECGTSVPQLEPRSFSFNSPYGACEECHGLGSTWAFDPGKVIVDPSKPLLDGGLGPGRGLGSWPCSSGWRNSPRKRAHQSEEALRELPQENARPKLLERRQRIPRAFWGFCKTTATRRKAIANGSPNTCRRWNARPAAASGCGRPAWRCG